MTELPARVETKLMALLDAEQQARTVVTMTQNAIREAQYAHDLNPHGDKAMALAREVARLQALQPDNQARHRAIADLNAKITYYLDRLPANVTLDDAKPIKLKLKPGETHLQSVVGLRLNIVKLIGERSEVERAGLPIDEIKAQAKKWITEMALKAQPAITATHEKFDVKFTFMDPDAYTATRDPLALLAWFDPELLETKLNELIDKTPKPKLALTPQEKAQRLASIKSELFSAEQLECAHIEAAKAEGTVIDQRPNVDIRALLGLVVIKDKIAA